MAARTLSKLEKALLGLRSLILGGEFAEGQRLPEVAVAKRLGISRTPLRQAMARLTAEGLLEQIETGGCRVATFTTDDITDAIEIRGVIEGTAARLAAERGVRPDLLAEARETVDLIDRALGATDGFDFEGYVKLNAQFHDLLARFPNSPLLEKEIERVSLLPLASPSSFLSDQARMPDFQESLRNAQRQHRAILDAIASREGARAEALTREHARLALQNFSFINDQRAASKNVAPRFALVWPR